MRLHCWRYREGAAATLALGFLIKTEKAIAFADAAFYSALAAMHRSSQAIFIRNLSPEIQEGRR